MKSKRFFVWLTLLVVIVTNTNPCTALQECASDVDTDTDVVASPSVNDDFADDRVLVILNNQTSLKFRSYTPTDFNEVDCICVSDLTLSISNKIKQKIENEDRYELERNNCNESAGKYENFRQILRIELPLSSKSNVLKAIEVLQKREDILYAGPDYVVSMFATSCNDLYRSYQWPLTSIELNKAWDVTTGSSHVVVGILDTGIDSSHPELAEKINIGASRDFTSGIGLPTVPTDPVGHGTRIAGIIGAATNNAEGIYGVCWDVELVSLRVLNEQGRGYSSDVAYAIDYAESINIPVLNLSLGWYSGSTRYDYALEAYVDNYSGLIVCAAGNDGLNIDNNMLYPAVFSHSNLITVGASTSSKTKLVASNYGQSNVDVFAPGDGLFSCSPIMACRNDTCTDETHFGNGYHYCAGTSMAAAYVTGIAALMLAENPNLTPTQIRQIIIDSCDTVSSLQNRCLSGGIVNAYHSLLHAYPNSTITLNSIVFVRITAGSGQWVSFTAPESRTYFFYTEGTVDVVGELFDEDIGYITYADEFDENDFYNFLISQYIPQGKTVYVKVSGYNTQTNGACYVKVGTTLS